MFVQREDFLAERFCELFEAIIWHYSPLSPAWPTDGGIIRIPPHTRGQVYIGHLFHQCSIVKPDNYVREYVLVGWETDKLVGMEKKLMIKNVMAKSDVLYPTPSNSPHPPPCQWW